METTHLFTPRTWKRIRLAYQSVTWRLGPSLSSQRPAAAGSCTESEWTDKLDEVISSFQDLNQKTENAFLVVGGKLVEFRAAARTIASQMNALTELISGEQGNKTSRALAGILEYSKRMDERAEDGVAALATIREASGRIPAAFSELRNRVMSFRALCTLTRIETSRLGATGADFDGLADAVKPLSEQIHLSGDRVLAASTELDGKIHRALVIGTDLQEKQLSILRSLIDGVIASLAKFEERCRQAQQSSVRMVSQQAAVCEALDKLVQSIQFHDITRQQVEHVTESLREVRDEFKDVSLAAELPSRARNALHIQALQLSAAEKTFTSSVNRMRQGLEDIHARIADMADTSVSLIGIHSDEQNSFFLQMERCCIEILEAVGACDSDSSRIQTMAGGLRETISRMLESVAEIQQVEIQIQRIAINATIRAAHIEDAGHALNTIADAMHRLVLDSSSNTEDAAQALDSMGGAARRVSSEPNAAGSKNDAIAQLRATILDLHAASECSDSQVGQIAALGRELGRDIRSVLDSFTAGDMFSKVVARAQTALEKISPDGVEVLAEAPDVHAPDLERFVDRYTMESERDVHDRAVNCADPVASPWPTGVFANRGEEGNLGDNVELF